MVKSGLANICLIHLLFRMGLNQEDTLSPLHFSFPLNETNQLLLYTNVVNLWKKIHECCSDGSWTDFIKHNVDKVELSLSTYVGGIYVVCLKSKCTDFPMDELAT
jgi:hypothetical protein